MWIAPWSLKIFPFFVIKVMCHFVRKFDKEDEVTKTEVSKELEVREWTSVFQFFRQLVIISRHCIFLAFQVF